MSRRRPYRTSEAQPFDGHGLIIAPGTLRFRSRTLRTIICCNMLFVAAMLEPDPFAPGREILARTFLLPSVMSKLFNVS